MRKLRPSAPPKPPTGGGGWGPSWGYLAAVVVLMLGGLGLVLSSFDAADDAAHAPQGAPPVAATTPAGSGLAVWSIQATVPAPVQHTMASDMRPTAEGDNDPTPDLSSYVARGAKPTMNEVIDRLHGAGVYTGLAAFNPPGTRPNLVGLAVPEDFVLPEGLVRHHQATDDGQRVEAILMYAPDRQFFDANHQPIAIPKNRVVPQEFAPPGLPIRLIVIPAPADAGRSVL